MMHRRGLFFMIFLFFYFAFAGEIVYLFLSFFEPEVVNAIYSSPWLTIFSYIFLILLPLAIWLAIFREKINMHLPHMRLGKINLICIIGLSFLMQPAMNFVSALTTLIFPNEMTGAIVEGMAYPYWLMIIAMAIMPAVCEEVIFRGYIQSTYKKKPLLTMMLINGLFFGLIHSTAQQVLYAFLIGVFFAYMVHVTRSIRTSIIMHFIMNASQITLLWVSIKYFEFMEKHDDMFRQMLGEAFGSESITEIIASGEMEISQSQMILTLVMVGILAIFTTTAAGFLLKFFAEHNRKRIAEYELKNPSENSDILIEETPSKKNQIIDALIILAIVALYVFRIFGTQ